MGLYLVGIVQLENVRKIFPILDVICFLELIKKIIFCSDLFLPPIKHGWTTRWLEKLMS